MIRGPGNSAINTHAAFPSTEAQPENSAVLSTEAQRSGEIPSFTKARAPHVPQTQTGQVFRSQSNPDKARVPHSSQPHRDGGDVSSSHSTLKSPVLRPGARIAIVSPASAAIPDRVHTGIAHLQALGYNPVLAPHALASSPLYFAGTVEDRLADLHAAFADPSIDAICCTRGGWGTAELLPTLDLDLIRRNPKPFLGYSDHTSLHIWMARETGLVTFYAPMVSPDFARRGTDGSFDGIDLRSFQAALTQIAPWQLTTVDGLRLLRPALPYFATNSSISRSIEVEKHCHPDRSRGPRQAHLLAGVESAAQWRDPLLPEDLPQNRPQGTLWGGCLSILAESLGTPFAPRPQGGILFLEDVTTKPYQWDRMLLHLRYAGLLAGVEAIVFGDMRQCVPPSDALLLEAALLHALADFPGPICIGLRSGHVDTPNLTLPFGIQATLDTSDPEHPILSLLESAVLRQNTP